MEKKEFEEKKQQIKTRRKFTTLKWRIFSANVDKWYSKMEEYTFKSFFIPISIQDVYSILYKIEHQIMKPLLFPNEKHENIYE
jgi:hypothetical protein